MDIIKFNDPRTMTDAEIVNGIKTKMWIERYLKEGEFTLTAPVSSGLRGKLPIGSFISHINTGEIMIVENHEIVDKVGSDPDITITGRGYETLMEQRIVGSNKTFPVSAVLTDYILDANYTWIQAVILIRDHILASSLIDDNSAFPNVSVVSFIEGTSISIERKFPIGYLYDHVMTLLKIDNLGIKVVRPGALSPLNPGNNNTAIVIHTGTDRSDEVIFSSDTGEIVSADYLWSNKKLKNAAFISGTWVQTAIYGEDSDEYNRRFIFVDGSDIDKIFTSPPVGPAVVDMVVAMQNRGIEVLRSQNDVALTKAEVSKESTKSQYRTDFDVGDLITVNGEYNETTKMRITEYVEIEDETGEKGYPTLSIE